MDVIDVINLLNIAHEDLSTIERRCEDLGMSELEFYKKA